MPRVVMYLEVPEGKNAGGETKFDLLCDTLQELVESDRLDGYFTLTFNGEAWLQERGELAALADKTAQTQKEVGA